MSDAVEVTDNEQLHRYEARLDGTVVGFAEYAARGDALVFPHTVVDPTYQGRGIGSIIVRHAMDDARAMGKRVVPQCPFVAAWIDRHPDYADLVS